MDMYFFGDDMRGVCLGAMGGVIVLGATRVSFSRHCGPRQEQMVCRVRFRNLGVMDARE